jgi:hypothetical protein
MPEQIEPEVRPALRLMQFITGHWVAAAVYAAARLKLADLLEQGPKTSDDLADAVGAHKLSVYRLMRALATLGIFEEIAPKRFKLSEVGDLLRTHHPESMRPMALFQGAPPHWKGWGSFLHSVETGKSAFEHVHGMGFFDYCQTDAEFAEAFNGAMTAMSAVAADAVVEGYEFSAIRQLVDVGGGHGYLISRILKRYPHLRGGLIDLPSVVPGARSALEEAGLLDRCEVVGGSFFDSVPSADAYIAKNIIHDWDDEHAQTILRNMRTAMQGKGKVLLVELVVTSKDKDATAVLIDLEMLHATHGGRERTEAEFAELFASSGLRLHRVLRTKSPFSVLEAVPAS